MTGRDDRERGAVTAELAVALPAVVLVLVAVLLTCVAGITQMRTSDAARAAARAAAAGEDDAQVVAVATHVGGADASASVSRADPWVTVTVTTPVAGGWLGGFTASAESSAWLESAVAAEGVP